MNDLPIYLKGSIIQKGGKNKGKSIQPTSEKRFTAIECWLNINLVNSVADNLESEVGVDFDTQISSWKVDRLLFQNTGQITQELQNA